MTSFLLSRPTPEQVIEFQASDAVNDRLHELLDKNSEGSLTAEEQSELNRFLEYDHIFTMLKAKARLQLAGED
ncbi:MAG: hypothetical protein H7175_10890 [Burkholderiales bacterium]|nr:hypothetical protein [Anaerolineae bacterium]